VLLLLAGCWTFDISQLHSCARALRLPPTVCAPVAVVLGLQELVDSARRLLDSNTSQLQQLCARSGFTPPDDQGVHEAYGAAVKEWEGQMLQRYSGARSTVMCTVLAGVLFIWGA
jgi:hypothetical protein